MSKRMRPLRALPLAGTAALLGALALAGCERAEQADVKFAPYSQDYASKPDFAYVEHKFPLTPQQLQTITPKYLATLDQEQVDQIYARLTAGPLQSSRESRRQRQRSSVLRLLARVGRCCPGAADAGSAGR